jgi:hypothetical protein
LGLAVVVSDPIETTVREGEDDPSLFGWVTPSFRMTVSVDLTPDDALRVEATAGS